VSFYGVQLLRRTCSHVCDREIGHVRMITKCVRTATRERSHAAHVLNESVKSMETNRRFRPAVLDNGYIVTPGVDSLLIKAGKKKVKRST
jgi:hypothetical protein